MPFIPREKSKQSLATAIPMTILAVYPDAFEVHARVPMVFSKIRSNAMVSESFSRIVNTYLDTLSSPLEYIIIPTPPITRPRLSNVAASSLYSFGSRALTLSRTSSSFVVATSQGRKHALPKNPRILLTRLFGAAFGELALGKLAIGWLSIGGLALALEERDL